MIDLTAGEISTIVEGTLHGDPAIRVSEPAVFDSRLAIQGSLFIALKGDIRDGHDFAKDALSKGANLVLASQLIDGPCVVVSDVRIAIGKLAQHVRQALPQLTVIGITGSQGKTTSKDLLSWVLSMNGQTVSAEGSFNNELGVPITLLRCTPQTRYCVLEMGARHKGDIAQLCEIASPDIGVVLKVGNAHVGEFGSREIIAKTKAELINSLPETGTAILGLYDEYTPLMAKGRTLRTLTFGETHDADVRATDVDIREGRAHFDLVTPQGRSAVGLRLIGTHQISNALAVASVATALDIPLDVIAVGLSTADVVSKWRMELHELDGVLLINDAYNANPDSTAAALRSLALFAQERGGQSWAFLGKMHELGEESARDHANIGTLAQSLGIDHLVAVGAREYGADVMPESAMRVHLCSDQLQAQEFVQHIQEGDVLLFKASRAEKFEELVKSVEQLWSEKLGDEA